MLKCPNNFTVDFGKKLIEYLDPTADISMIKYNWCWKDFGEQFKYLESKIMRYFEQVKEGEPVKAVFYLIHYCKYNIEWGKKTIENNQIGQFAYYTYLMASNHYCTCQWAEKIIENSQSEDRNKAILKMLIVNNSKQSWFKTVIMNSRIGDPSNIVYFAVRHNMLNRKWAENFISNCKIGNPSYAAFLMVRDCNSDYKWAQIIIDNCEVGDIAMSAVSLLRIIGNSYITIKWVNKIIKKSNNCNICFPAYIMVRDYGFSIQWFINIVNKYIIEDKLFFQKYNPSYIIYILTRYHNLNRLYAEMIIKKCKKNNHIIDLMVRYCGSSKKWAENIKNRYNNEI